MEFFSASDIRTFVDPRSFAVSRTQARGTTPPAERLAPVTTTDTNASFSLLLGAEQRLADLRTSLQSMLDLAIEGAAAGRNERKYDQAYGKLRSLSAGFGQVLEASSFKGTTLFDGRDWEVQSAGRTTRFDNNLNLSLFNQDGLALVENNEGAQVTIGYDAATIIRNANSGLAGLDLTDGIGIARTDGLPELESGKYRLEIEYNGPASRLILSDEFGAKIETLEGVDLTGTGTEIVKFAAGIMLNLEKIQASENFDKFDYKNDGPVSLYADLQYERVNWHTLAGDTNDPNATAEAEWAYKPARNHGQPALNFRDIAANGVAPGKLELAEGTYQVRVTYRDDNSLLEIRDVNGRLKARLTGIDLTGPGDHTIDTGLGFRFSIENRDWTPGEEKVLRANVEYRPVKTGERDFDFIGFGQRVVNAIELVSEQLSSVTTEIEEMQQLQALLRGQSNGAPSAALTLLGAAGGGNGVLSLLNGGNVQNRINVSGLQLFASINQGAATQGGTPSVLSFLA